MELDATMIGRRSQTFSRTPAKPLKACRKRAPADFQPEIRVTLEDRRRRGGDHRIADNGIGLPADRARLFEPYVTTREKGTGLGLPIVKKIIEEHGGTLALLAAPIFEGTGTPGPCAEIRLPRSTRRNAKSACPTGNPGQRKRASDDTF